MEKNYFAALDYRLLPAFGVAVFLPVISIGSLSGFFHGGVAGIAAGCSFFALALPAAGLARKLGWSWTGALLTPFVFQMLCYSMLRSTLITLRQRGVRWRDQFYDLAELKKFGVR